MVFQTSFSLSLVCTYTHIASSLLKIGVVYKKMTLSNNPKFLLTMHAAGFICNKIKKRQLFAAD